MTFEQALQERLEALLRTLRNEDTSDMLMVEYARILGELNQLQDEREFK